MIAKQPQTRLRRVKRFEISCNPQDGELFVISFLFASKIKELSLNDENGPPVITASSMTQFRLLLWECSSSDLCFRFLLSRHCFQFSPPSAPLLCKFLAQL